MNIVPVSIPRWQWRTAASDLSWLFKRLPVPLNGPGRRVEETHLVCLRSSHSAVLRADRLEVRWRKEISPEGFELWDTILDSPLPFAVRDLERLWSAWGLPRPQLRPEYATVESFLEEVVAPELELTAVDVVRVCRETSFQGIGCSVETIDIRRTIHLESFAIEHEDPALMTQLLTSLGLKPSANTNFLQSLRNALDLRQPEPGFTHG